MIPPARRNSLYRLVDWDILLSKKAGSGSPQILCGRCRLKCEMPIDEKTALRRPVGAMVGAHRSGRRNGWVMCKIATSGMLAVLALSVVVVGCDTKPAPIGYWRHKTKKIIAVAPGDAEEVSAAPQETAPIEVLLFEVEEGLNVHRKPAREYEKQRPGVRISISGSPRIADKLRIRILEGSFPEITCVGINYWSLIRSGYMLPLDEFLDGPNWEGTGTWRDSFLPGSLDRHTYQGKTYAVPAFYNVQMMWYNKKMFAEHGWAPPKTWGELFALCEKIKAAGIWPMAFQGMYHSYAQTFIDNIYYQLVGLDRYYDQQLLVPGSYNNPKFVQALAWTQRLATNYFQAGSMGMNHKEAQLEFFLGHTAMVKCQASLVYEMHGKIPEDFSLGAFNLPTVENPRGDPTAVTPGIGYFFVFKKSRQPRQAVDFVRFLTSKKTASYLTKVFDIPTAVKGTTMHLSESLGDVVKVIDAARATYGLAPGEGYPEMQQYLGDVRF
ncbi:MAG: extracellular solute-binding protein, partial [Phycisphaerae bacterium]|nr:extracellular solute-binding protein [Phycisphaerae bacterium]